MRVVNVLKLALFAGVFASAIASADKIEARSDLFEQSHPSQYKTWGKTAESSNKLDVLAEDPKMIILWAGYPFSKDRRFKYEVQQELLEQVIQKVSNILAPF